MSYIFKTVHQHIYVKGQLFSILFTMETTAALQHKV